MDCLMFMDIYLGCSCVCMCFHSTAASYYWRGNLCRMWLQQVWSSVPAQDDLGMACRVQSVLHFSFSILVQTFFCRV